jgi:hypothetical protein
MVCRAGVIALVGLVLAGCHAAQRRDCVSLYEARQVGEPYPLVEQPTVAALTSKPEPASHQEAPRTRPLQVLAVCAGGVDSAFSAGAVYGWTKSGTRPTFDVVTGTSSGALVGVYAFLGPKYDGKLEALFTNASRKDLFAFRPLRGLLQDGALASAEPMEKILEAEVNLELLADLRDAHAQGRRLFIGTTNVQTRRLVIWDVGAIASSDRPEAPELIRKILLASASWPGLLPPVEFLVEVDGQWRREEHIDGGAAAQCFVRFGPTAGWPGPDGAGSRWLEGSNLYVIGGGKLYDDHGEVPKRLFSRVLHGVGCLTSALARSDMHRLHALCMGSGMRFHLLVLPEESVGAQQSIMKMRTDVMRRLFNEGYRLTANGIPWRHTPPGAARGEEEVPRGVLADGPVHD